MGSNNWQSVYTKICIKSEIIFHTLSLLSDQANWVYMKLFFFNVYTVV